MKKYPGLAQELQEKKRRPLPLAVKKSGKIPDEHVPVPEFLLRFLQFEAEDVCLHFGLYCFRALLLYCRFTPFSDIA